MKKACTILLAAAFLITALPSALFAQDAPPPVSEMWMMVPKADQRSEFYEGLKAHMEFRSEAGDPRAWNTYTPMLGDEIDRVVVRYCCFEWADADAYRAWSEENPEVGKHWQENVDPYVESYGHYFDEVDWANSNIRGEWGPWKYFAETKFDLKPGDASTFDAVRDKISQIALNQGYATEDRPWIWATGVGGSKSESIVVPMKGLANMAPSGETFFNFLARILGSDEAAEELFAKLTESVEKQDFQIWELHEDMSMKRAE
jgi:hypothetical protein